MFEFEMENNANYLHSMADIPPRTPRRTQPNCFRCPLWCVCMNVCDCVDIQAAILRDDGAGLYLIKAHCIILWWNVERMYYSWNVCLRLMLSQIRVISAKLWLIITSSSMRITQQSAQLHPLSADTATFWRGKHFMGLVTRVIFLLID